MNVAYNDKILLLSVIQWKSIQGDLKWNRQYMTHGLATRINSRCNNS